MMAEGSNSSNNTVERMANEMLGKIRTFFGDVKTKFLGEEFMTFDEAARVLHDELNYPQDRALNFVRRFDRNNDGRLSVKEFQVMKKRIEETHIHLVPKFREYDINGDGFITLDEASKILRGSPFNFPDGKVLLLLRSFDKDGNGKLDIKEFAGFYSEAKALNDDIALCFDQLDRDGNGVLSPDEVVSIVQTKMGFDEKTARHLVEVFDQNKDGSLDKTEFMQLWTTMFGQ